MNAPYEIESHAHIHLVTDRADPRKTVVAVITYRRPDELAMLLPALLDQADREQEHGQRVEVLVVDNDPDGGARGTVARFDDPRLRYLIEPVPGIAAARNAALDTIGDAQYLVFIDDDEQPEDGWLRRLRETQTAARCAAVSGPVLSVFAHPVDRWITKGGFFDRGRRPTGSTLTQAATNNLRLDVTRLGALRFDERFGLSGGSDTLFTRQLVASGERIVWCDDAVVTETVPPERTTRDWVIRRTYRLGNTDSRSSLAMATPGRSRRYQQLRALWRGGLRIVLGHAAYLAGCLLRSVLLQAQARRLRARGEGIAAGALGRVHVEYARPEPDSSKATT